MARSIETIYNEILIEKDNMTVLKNQLYNENGTTILSDYQNLLTGLQSTVPVAIWKLWAFITSVTYNFEEQRWDDFVTQIEGIKDSTPVYNKKWWNEKVLYFQNGYIIEINPVTNAPYYSVIDLNARILTTCTVTDLAGKVVLKVRRKDTDLLSVGELASLTAYIGEIKPVGDKVIINNFLPDNLKLYYKIYYNPLVDVTNIKSSVESVINDYIQNLGFDDEFNVTVLTDRIQQLSGVIDPVYISGEGRSEAGSFITIENYYKTVAGYAKIDDLFTLSSTITYIAKIN